ncbi:hypothetical protein GCM10027403_14580 [Arthrobacter tecti]
MDSVRDYLVVATGESSIRAIAGKSGVDQSTLFRQLERGMKAETLIRVCRAYDLSPLNALVVAGILSVEEAGHGARSCTLADVSNADLADEVRRRLR